MLCLLTSAWGLSAPSVLRTAIPGQPQSHTVSSVEWTNPLQVDGFCEHAGWGWHEDPQQLPLLVFLPGMDGSLLTPFMQYPELGARFELACMQHVGGMSSRRSFPDLVSDCANFVASQTSAGRRVVLVGESFGATLTLGVLDRMRQDELNELPAGAVLVNPATCYDRSILSSVGPACASLPQPLYSLSLLLLSGLVFEPAQAPAFIALILALRQPALLASPAREAYLGRVALSALMGVANGPQFQIGPLLRPRIFSPSDLAFRLSAWLEMGAAAVAPTISNLQTPILLVAGARDRLLPSVDEAERLSSQMPAAVNRGTVIVPCAGHASTLGTQIDLAAEICAAFAPELGLQIASGGSKTEADARPPIEAPNQPSGVGAAWAKGLIPRTYDSLPVLEYREWNRGGKRCPVTS
jgi:pimeloyl-ACP methyl ester carboxylesterase